MAALGHIADSDTFALWRCDETSGDLTDAVGTVHLSASGSPGSATGLINRCRTFTAGSQRFVRTISARPEEAAVFLTGSYTVERWVNLNNVAPSVTSNLFSVTTNVANMAVTTARTMIGTVGTSAINSTAGAVPVNGWTHCSMVVEVVGGAPTQRDVSLYVNGALSGTTTRVTPTFGSAAGLYVGGAANSLIAFHDDTRVSLVARTAAEVLNSYQRGIGTFAAPPLPQGRPLGWPPTQSSLLKPR